MRATDDDRGREALAWTSGLLDRLPAEVTHPILACARDVDGWAILMRDVGDALFPPHDPYVGTPIALADDDRILDALAALHVAFWEEPEAADPALGFCTPEQRYRSFSPETGRREVGGPDFYPGIIRDGWELLPTLMDPGVADLLIGLAVDPTARDSVGVLPADGRPRRSAPTQPWAATHGATTGWCSWTGSSGPGTPGADLTWYLHCAGPSRRSAVETGIACYRGRLAQRLGSRFDERGGSRSSSWSLLGQMLRCAHDLAWARSVTNRRRLANGRARAWSGGSSR